jgi:hypothetical protein
LRRRYGWTPLRPVLMILAMGMAGLLMLGLAGSARTASRIAVGNKPAEIAFRDLAGERHMLHKAGSRPAVYLFLSTQCPAAKAYSPRIVALEKAYRAKGVRFFRGFFQRQRGSGGDPGPRERAQLRFSHRSGQRRAGGASGRVDDAGGGAARFSGRDPLSGTY